MKASPATIPGPNALVSTPTPHNRPCPNNRPATSCLISLFNSILEISYKVQKSSSLWRLLWIMNMEFHCPVAGHEKMVHYHVNYLFQRVSGSNVFGGSQTVTHSPWRGVTLTTDQQCFGSCRCRVQGDPGLCFDLGGRGCRCDPDQWPLASMDSSFLSGPTRHLSINDHFLSRSLVLFVPKRTSWKITWHKCWKAKSEERSTV